MISKGTVVIIKQILTFIRYKMVDRLNHLTSELAMSSRSMLMKEYQQT